MLHRLLGTLRAWISTLRETSHRVPLTGKAYILASLGLAAVAALLWYHVATWSDDRLHVYFLDVGQGDSVFIVTPEGKQVLVDGGPKDMVATRFLGRRLALWDRDLDLVVLTHPDEDHFRGLIEVVDRYDTAAVLEGSRVFRSPLYLEWERKLGKQGIQRLKATQGQTIDLGGSVTLQVLNPSDEPIAGTQSDANNNGVVLRLAYGGVSFLLTADVESEAEGRLLREDISLRSNVLKVAHHGSKTSTTPAFLTAVSPVAAVISAGANNRYGHPHLQVASRLEELLTQDRIFMTSETGDIEFITDGGRLWVKTQQ